MKQKTSLFFKIILFVCALSVCFFACSKKSSKYDIINFDYYINKVKEFEEENKLYKDKGVDCVFIGDSWTDGYRPLEEYYCEITVLNRGIGGDNSYGLLQRLKVSVYDVKPKVVVMLIGGNNMYDCNEDIEQIILDIKNNLPETKIVMQSMYTISNPDFKDKTDRIIEMCDYFKSLCNTYGLTYVDLYSHLIDENGSPLEKYHVDDGVHMSTLGYQVITEHLKPVIYQLLNS